MKFISILESISKTLDKFILTDTLLEKNTRSAKRIKSIERRILSQGKQSVVKYQKLTETVYSNNIIISNKAISQSFRSRIEKQKDFYPIDELLTGFYTNDILLDKSRLDFSLFHEVQHLYIQESSYSELYLAALTVFVETEVDLIYKRLISSLLDLKSKTIKLHKTFIQIPIIASFLEFFDQVFTLKDNEITYSDLHNSFNINVKTNKYRNGQSIYGFIPITS